MLKVTVTPYNPKHRGLTFCDSKPALTLAKMITKRGHLWWKEDTEVDVWAVVVPEESISCGGVFCDIDYFWKVKKVFPEHEKGLAQLFMVEMGWEC